MRRDASAVAVTSGSDGIVKEFHEALQRSPDTAVAVAAIKVLHFTSVLENMLLL